MPRMNGVPHVSVPDLFAFITSSYETRRAWYGLFYHEPPAQLRVVTETGYGAIRTFVDPAGREGRLINWALDNGYIRKNEHEQHLLPVAGSIIKLHNEHWVDVQPVLKNSFHWQG